MYIPSAFEVTDLPMLHALMQQNSFGVLVSSIDGAPFATHLPFLLEAENGPYGTLVGHMARANPHWQMTAGQPVLTIFSGPHAYISPTWYQAEHMVPTWNFTAVHAYGTLQLIEEPTALLDIVQRSVEFYEAIMPKPWSLNSTGPFVERLLTQIVGFRIVIDRLEGKWKLNQNHLEERRLRVIEALRNQSGDNAQGIAALMEATLPPRGDQPEHNQ